MSIQFQAKYLRETQVKEMSASTGAGAYPASLSATEKQYKGPEIEEDAPMLAHGKANIKTYTKDGFKKTKRGTSGMKGVIPKDLWEDEGDTTSYSSEDVVAAANSEIQLEEARNYHQFKREAATRTKAQQMHEAAKMINNKLDEINRLLEYTNQMRGELSEGEEQLEYKHNTKALFEKMNKKVVEAYTKLKKVK